MELQLAGRRALVTGASKGIGRATAMLLASEGCPLLLVARSAEDLERARADITARHDVPVEVQARDLSRTEEVEALARDAGRVDILVNNAGAIPRGRLDELDEPEWRTAWDLKVFGYINLTRRIYPQMREAGGGVIINVIGLAGERPNAGYIAGSSGNAALMAFTRSLGATSRRDDIRVVGVNPGLIETERLATLLRGEAERRLGDAERWRELLDQRYPPGRPEDIANLVAFLASPRATNITGTIVTADGGAASR